MAALTLDHAKAVDAGARDTEGEEWWTNVHREMLACPYRCQLDSKSCPVDILVEELNKPRVRRTAPAPAPAAP